jgi:hypothetical protein
MQLDRQGNLLLHTGGGTLVQQVPTLYQIHDGTRQAVTGHCALGTGDAVGFQPGAYDPGRPLYIDPILNASPYLGGSGTDKAFGIAVDAAGNTYVTGNTASSNFPVTVGGRQRFVTRRFFRQAVHRLA